MIQTNKNTCKKLVWFNFSSMQKCVVNFIFNISCYNIPKNLSLIEKKILINIFLNLYVLNFIIILNNIYIYINYNFIAYLIFCIIFIIINILYYIK